MFELYHPASSWRWNLFFFVFFFVIFSRNFNFFCHLKTDKIDSCNMKCMLFSLLSRSSTNVCLRPSRSARYGPFSIDNEMRFLITKHFNLAYYSCFLEPDQISSPLGLFSGMSSLLNQCECLHGKKILPHVFCGLELGPRSFQFSMLICWKIV